MFGFIMRLLSSVLSRPTPTPVPSQPQPVPTPVPEPTPPAPEPAPEPAPAPKPKPEKHMLKFKLEREIFNSKCTIGKIYTVAADGTKTFVCWCLEDVLRPDGVKVKHKTAIPAGTYKVTVTMSNRFKRLMCELANVKDFAGIRIHGGNEAKHSSGCLIVAKNKVDNDTIQGSMEQYFTDAVAAAKTAEIEIGYAAGVTPVYQTDVNAGE